MSLSLKEAAYITTGADLVEVCCANCDNKIYVYKCKSAYANLCSECQDISDREDFHTEVKPDGSLCKRGWRNG